MLIIRKANSLKDVFPQYYNSLKLESSQLSYYTHIEHVSNGEYILFSFVSDAIVSLTKEEYDIIKNGQFEKNISLFNTLQNLGFFCDKNVDEIFLMYQHRLSFDNVDTDVLKIVFLPTTKCNARCAYCCGANNPFEVMTIETASKAVDFIVDIAQKYDRIQFGWYGGEPLLEANLITFISEEVQRRLPQIKFSSYIISNTLLFDDNVLDKMVKSWKVKRIGITFDGTEAEHNRRKNYMVSSLNGFEQTLNAIQPLLDKGILVQCRFNVDRDNIKQLKPLIEVLIPYLSNPLFYFYVSFLKGSDSNEAFFDKNEYNNLIYDIGKIYIDFDMRNSIFGLLLNVFTKWCQGKSKNSFTIAPNGNIYKCNLVDLVEKNAIGTVYSGFKNDYINDEFLLRDLDDTCLNCKFLPICQGGCPADMKKASKSISKCNEFKYRIKGVANVLADYYNKL